MNPLLMLMYPLNCDIRIITLIIYFISYRLAMSNELGNFRIISRRGSLFSAPKHHSLAHCISRDAKMGRGIAVQFRKRFGGRGEILELDVGVGGVAVLRRGDRYIYNLVTKERANGKPTYENIRRSLTAMKEHALQHNVVNISMPRIACGLDEMQWGRVKELLEFVFNKTNITLTVYQLK